MFERASTAMDFHAVVERGNLQDVRRMVRIGASLSTPDRHGNTPMHLAAANGHVLIMAMIAQRDVDLCARNLEEQTPIHLAAANGHRDGALLISLAPPIAALKSYHLSAGQRS